MSTNENKRLICNTIPTIKGIKQQLHCQLNHCGGRLQLWNLLINDLRIIIAFIEQLPKVLN